MAERARWLPLWQQVRWAALGREVTMILSRVIGRRDWSIDWRTQLERRRRYIYRVSEWLTQADYDEGEWVPTGE